MSVKCYTRSPTQTLTNVPTVTPAAIDGTEPVLMYPVIPPPAVKAPRIYAGVSIPLCAVSFCLLEIRGSFNYHLSKGGSSDIDVRFVELDN